MMAQHVDVLHCSMQNGLEAAQSMPPSVSAPAADVKTAQKLIPRPVHHLVDLATFSLFTEVLFDPYE